MLCILVKCYVLFSVGGLCKSTTPANIAQGRGGAGRIEYLHQLILSGVEVCGGLGPGAVGVFEEDTARFKERRCMEENVGVEEEEVDSDGDEGANKVVALGSCMG
ncbi:hypothetical protein CYMTET_56060 [Cymbomonas tetramitiformis]|uniref:Uncharacterized protein n=1 Tax=Cymbomonas tetramitiformis TaxID=36881 RepID=A0AAE0BBN7_9CHLO|nr:hypothetical protein CYMTET_56060 [Cymbomonas tetramitiformis]